jgi:AAA+ ATPase superfamily predicted ATPase
LLQFEQSKKLKENICTNILNKGKILYNEVDFLIKQELREPLVYYTIIEKIAFGATKLNEIHNKTQISTNKLAVYLKNLIELGIVTKEYPITEKIKVKINLHSGLYKLKNRRLILLLVVCLKIYL